MKTLELFAGVGALALGMKRAGFDTVAFSEYDPAIAAKRGGHQYAAEVFAKHWPDARALGDIQKIDWDEHRDLCIEFIGGGFPCTDVSSAGKQAGIKVGTRSGLWFEYKRAIQELRPKGVLIENVANLAGNGLDIVLRDLAELGYDAEWDVISAAGVGAPHLRERLFIIAWPTGTGQHGGWPTPEVSDWWAAEPEDAPRLVVGKVDERVARLRCLGNSVVPACAEHVARLLLERLGPDHERGVDWWDAKYKSGERKGLSICIGSASPFGPMCNGEITPPTLPSKLPRAGRMTQGDCYERVRSCTQKHAKAVALASMAPTLRWLPTPSAGNFNDGEDPDKWLARREKLKAKGINGNGAGMPLGIAVKLLPTPRTCAGVRSIGMNRTEMMDALGETVGDQRLLPTPSSSDPIGSRTLPPGTTDTRIAPNGKKYQVGLENAVKLLPTPRASANENRQTKPTPSQLAGTHGRSLAAEIHIRETGSGGNLNPDFVEWLMGVPQNWSKL